MEHRVEQIGCSTGQRNDRQLPAQNSPVWDLVLWPVDNLLRVVDVFDTMDTRSRPE